MKKYTVYMILGNKEEVRLYNCKTLEEAELKCRVEQKRDAQERAAGYKVPECKYVIK